MKTKIPSRRQLLL